MLGRVVWKHWSRRTCVRVLLQYKEGMVEWSQCVLYLGRKWYVYAPQSGKPDIYRRINFMVREYDIKGTKEFTLEIGDFNSWKKVGEFEGVYGVNGIGE